MPPEQTPAADRWKPGRMLINGVYCLRSGMFWRLVVPRTTGSMTGRAWRRRKLARVVSTTPPGPVNTANGEARVQLAAS